MKKIIVIIAIVIIGILVISYQLFVNKRKLTSLKLVNNQSQISLEPKIIKQPMLHVTSFKLHDSKSIFIPYWSIATEAAQLKQYNKLYYFGVTTANLGINRHDSGYLNLKNFTKTVESTQESVLVLRMLDENDIHTVLDSENLQNKIIEDLIDVAQENQFKGIALDLEISTLFPNAIENKITLFSQKLFSLVKKAKLKTSLIVYGDVFYRKRPFNLAILTHQVDEVAVMAYDLHKSRGEPGPNFPFLGKEKYGYDFQTMIGDFIKVVPKEKLNIIFGMFGYEWSVDENKKPVVPAKPLSLNEIKSKFLEKCEWEDCVIKRDQLSGETEINHITSQLKNDFAYLYYNIVWFEDEQSVKTKSDWLKQQGIANVAFWAYGYY